MKSFVPGFICLVLVAGSTLHAQDLTGQWQGTMHGDEFDRRYVVMISKTDGGGWKLVLTGIDEMSRPVGANPVSFQDGTLKFTIPANGGVYVGKLSPDGNTFIGHWTWWHKSGALPLNLTRATSETAWTIPKQPPLPKPMTDPNPSFEVATIKLSNPSLPGSLPTAKGGRFVMANMPLILLITYAFGVQAHQIVGGPPWMTSERIDVVGQPEGEGTPSNAQWKIMVQKLLAERFQLTFHRDKKELQVYLIVPAKAGPKIAPSEIDNPMPVVWFQRAPGGVGIQPRNASMADFAEFLQTFVVDRPVIDKTGLPGRFDFQLFWAPDESLGGFMGGFRLPPDEAPAPDLFTAMQQELGLKLESVKQPTDILVIERLEKPSEN